MVIFRITDNSALDINKGAPTRMRMGARNFSLSQFGATDDSSATGLYIGSISYGYEADKVDLKNHIGSTVGFTLADDRTTVTFSGAVVSKTAGIVPALASVVTLANTTANSLNLNTKGIFSTPVSNAGTVIISATLQRTSSEYETGDLNGIYHPGVTTNAPVSLT